MLQWMIDNDIHKYISYISLILMVGGFVWLIKRFTKEAYYCLIGACVGSASCGVIAVVIVSCFFWLIQLLKYISGNQVILFSEDLASAQLFVGGLFAAIGGVIGMLISVAVVQEEKKAKKLDSTSKSSK